MDKIKQSIGIYLDLSEPTYNHPEEAEKKIDVRVKVNEDEKDFSFRELRGILGF